METQSTSATRLTPNAVRRLLRKSQVQVAAAAGTSVSTVRVFELDDQAVRDPEKRRALRAVYMKMRDDLLASPA